MNKENDFIGILVENQIQRKHVLRQYLQYNTANLKLFCFTPLSINWNKESVVGLYRSNGRWVNGRFSFPQVVYNRCYGEDQEVIERLGAVIGKNKCFNHISQFNKLEIYNKQSRWLVEYLPETVNYNNEDVVQFLDKHKILYLKPTYGHKGKGVYRVEWKNSEEIYIGYNFFTPRMIVRDFIQFQEHVHKLIGSTPYIIQKGINIQQINNQIFDIRALVQKNEKGLWSVTNLVSRIASTGSYNTSLYEKACLTQEVLKCLYPPKKVNAIVLSIFNNSLRTAEIIDTETNYHMGELSVDFALDNDGHAWIIEVNGKPQKNLYNGIRKQQVVYKRPLQYAEYLCKH